MNYIHFQVDWNRRACVQGEYCVLICIWETSIMFVAPQFVRLGNCPLHATCFNWLFFVGFIKWFDKFEWPCKVSLRTFCTARISHFQRSLIFLLKGKLLKIEEWKAVEGNKITVEMYLLHLMCSHHKKCPPSPLKSHKLIISTCSPLKVFSSECPNQYRWCVCWYSPHPILDSFNNSMNLAKTFETISRQN